MGLHTPPTYHNPVAIPAAMATVVAAMAALAAAVTATLAALHLENSSSHHSTDPRTAENALLALQNSGRLPYNNSGRLHTHLFIIY